MNICIANNIFKPYSRGGADKISENIYNKLKKDGHNVCFITTCPMFSLKKKEHFSNGKYFYSLFSYYNKIPFFLRFILHITNVFSIRKYFVVRSYLKENKVDVLITNNLLGLGHLIPFATKRLNIKNIHILHDIQLLHPSGLLMLHNEEIIDSRIANIYQSINKFLFKDVNKIISPSKWLLDIYVDKGFFKDIEKKVVPNPVELNFEKTKKMLNEKFRLLYVGELNYHKGTNLLLQLLDNIKELNIEIVVIGEGNDKHKLSKKAGESIKILGWQDNSKVREVMHNSNALLLTSICYENSPTVLYEAASCSLPIIAPRIGGITEFIHKNGGILYEAGNINNLLDKIHWCIKNPHLIKDMGGKENINIKKIKSFENYIDNILF